MQQDLPRPQAQVKRGQTGSAGRREKDEKRGAVVTHTYPTTPRAPPYQKGTPEEEAATRLQERTF